MNRHARFPNLSLIVIGALPASIALALCARMLWVIWPELELNRRYGALEGLALMVLPGFAAVAFGAWGLYRKQAPKRSAKIVLLSLALACFYGYFHLPDPQPAMRSWVFDADTYTTVVIAAQLPLFYYLVFQLAAAFQIETRRGLVLSGLATLAVPVTLYAGFHLVRFMPHGELFPQLAQILFLVLNAVFSFLLLRLLLYVGRRHAERLRQPRNFAFAQFFFVGALPFLGLVLNAHGPLARESQATLGNFSSLNIWLMALLNAILFILPSVKNPRLSLLLFALRAAGLVFVLYFCVVFLLFLPLALVLIVAFGLGFLLLIPYLALAFQVVRLRRDFAELALVHGSKTIGLALLGGALLLPTFLLSHMVLDRGRLATLISFVQRPPLDLNQKPPVSAESALAFTQTAERHGRGFRRSAGHLPIYDSLYRTVVFDGVELSENLRRRIERVFSAGIQPERAPNRMPATAQLKQLASESRAQGNLTVSTLRVRLGNTTSAPAEFSGTIELPAGVFVTGHWLTIDGVEVPAQITTKNTAIWVYDRITERQRDPSLIYYEGPQQLRWRVFPVPANGFREARLELTHAYDAILSVAGEKVTLAARTSAAPAFISRSGRMQLLAPASQASTFTRTPYLHWIVDCSAASAGDITAQAKTAAALLGLPLQSSRVSYVNSSLRTENFSGALECPHRRDGFFPELAIRAILHDAYLAGGKTFPLLVVISAQKPRPAWEDLSFVSQYYADADGFYQVNGASLLAWTFLGNALATGRPAFPLPVRNAGGRIVSAKATLVPGANGGGELWHAIDGFEQHLDFWSGDSTARARAVMTAVAGNILNPASGSIVLETEAQRRRLAELHQQMLKATNELDAGEPVRMSEPWLYLVVVGAVAAVARLRRRR